MPSSTNSNAPKKSWLSMPSFPSSKVTKLQHSLFFSAQLPANVKAKSPEEISTAINSRDKQDNDNFITLAKSAIDMVAVPNISGTYKTVPYVVVPAEKNDEDSEDSEVDEEPMSPNKVEPIASGSRDSKPSLFRPLSEESYEIMSYLPLPFTKPCTVYRTGYVCEAAASVLNALLGFNVVPLTRVARVKGQLGALVESDEDAVPAFEFFKSSDIEQSREWIDIQVQQLAVVDWLCRNSNRTPGNWYVNSTTKRVHGTGQDTGFDACFPFKHPWTFKWNLPEEIMSCTWSDEIRQAVIPLLTSKAWWKTTSEALYHVFFDNYDDFEEGLWITQWAIFRGQAYLLLSNLLNHQSSPNDLSRGYPKLMITYQGGMEKAPIGVDLYIEPKGC